MAEKSFILIAPKEKLKMHIFALKMYTSTFFIFQVIVQLQILINHMKQVAVVGGGGLRHQIAVSHLGRNA